MAPQWTLQPKCHAFSDRDEVASVAHVLQGLGRMRSLRAHLHELTVEWKNAAARHPRALVAAIAIFLVLAVGSLTGLAAFYNGLNRGLPGEEAVRHISEMAVATAVYDQSDRLVFTRSEERRVGKECRFR